MHQVQSGRSGRDVEANSIGRASAGLWDLLLPRIHPPTHAEAV